MNGWFPRLSVTGQIASGYGQVYVGDRLVLDPGVRPQWQDEATVVALGPADGLYAIDVATGDQTLLTATVPDHVWAAGGGKWVVKAGNVIALTYDPITGDLLKELEHGGRNDDRSILVEDAILVAHRPIHEVRAFDGLIVWTETTRWPERHVWGIDRHGDHQIHQLRVTPPGMWSGSPIPIRVAGEAWLLVMTNVDLRLYPWRATQGYIIRTGEDQNFNPDAVGLGDSIRVVWQDAQGMLTVRDVPLSAPREDVTVGLAPPPPAPPPPPKEPEPMPTLPTSLLAAVAAERAKYGPEPTGIELGEILNTVAWQHRADGWGLSAKPGGTRVLDPAGRSIAHDILHHQPTDTLWDCLEAAGAAARPTWNLVTHHGDPDRPWLPPVAPTGPTDPPPAPPPSTDPSMPVAALRARVAVLEAELVDCHAEIAEWRGHVMANDDYEGLLAVARAAGQVFTQEARRPMHTELAMHLASRFILLRHTAEMVIEEARLQARGEWHGQW